MKIPFQHTTIVGRIAELLAERDINGSGIVVIEEFVVAPARHETFGMPYLVRRRENPQFVIVHAKVFYRSHPPILALTIIIQEIKFDFNVQHDCSFAGCSPTGKRPRVQERYKPSIRRATRRVGSVVGRVDLMARFGPQVQ